MQLNESPLLHQPDMMLAVLRVAAAGAGTVDDCVEYLRRLRRFAQVDEPMPEEDVRARLETAQAKLRLAGLIEVNGGGRSRITAFGQQVLDEHPRGVDDSVLTKLAEPPRADARRPNEARPRRPASIDYQRGYEAYLAGAGLGDNPFPRDMRAHLDWENGWSQARDDELG
jgi:restriction system protein